jgi:hypothetical protein
VVIRIAAPGKTGRGTSDAYFEKRFSENLENVFVIF